MVSITRFLLFGLSSDELASDTPPERAAAITAICKPRQSPRYGSLDLRANWADFIFPSSARDPNPPGTTTPAQPSSAAVISALGSSRLSASIQRMVRLQSFHQAAARNASNTDI